MECAGIWDVIIVNDFTEDELILIKKKSQKYCLHNDIIQFINPSNKKAMSYKCKLCDFEFEYWAQVKFHSYVY